MQHYKCLSCFASLNSPALLFGGVLFYNIILFIVSLFCLLLQRHLIERFSFPPPFFFYIIQLIFTFFLWLLLSCFTKSTYSLTDSNSSLGSLQLGFKERRQGSSVHRRSGRKSWQSYAPTHSDRTNFSLNRRPVHQRTADTGVDRTEQKRGNVQLAFISGNSNNFPTGRSLKSRDGHTDTPTFLTKEKRRVNVQ